jgi:hypothetical protein
MPTGEPGFAVLGDAPYSDDEVERLERLIDEMNTQPLAFVVHVGDIGSSRLACGDDWILARKKQFSRVRHPFILVPGDNEWSDCKDPVARLQRWRELFCGTSLKVEVQKGPFCEHLRWQADGLVFVTLNVPGSNNNVRHPEHAPRMQAVLAWLDEAAALAQGARGLVVLMQANPFVTLPRDGFSGLRKRLEQLAEKSPGKITLIHGDTHLHRDDEPLAGVRRIEVWGSPIVAWHRLAFSELPSRSPR